MTEDETKAHAKDIAVEFAWDHETADNLTVADLHKLSNFFFHAMNRWYRHGYDDATAEHYRSKTVGAN